MKYSKIAKRFKKKFRKCRGFLFRYRKFWGVLVVIGTLAGLFQDLIKPSIEYISSNISITKTESNFSPIFQKKDSLKFKILITRFEDYINKEDTECIGRSIQESIGVIEANDNSSVKIQTVYEDNIPPPKSAEQARAIQKLNNADLIIYGLANNVSNCDSANICFRYNFIEQPIFDSHRYFDIKSSKHDAEYILTSPLEIEKGNFQINQLSIKKWVSLLAEFTVNDELISFDDLETIMIDSDTLSLDSKVESYIDIAKTCKSFRKYGCAIKAYDKAICIFPNSGKLYNERGLVYKGNKQKDSALVDFSKAIKNSPNFSDAHYNKAIVYRQLNDHTSSIQCLKNAIKLKQTNEDYYIELAFNYSKLEQYDKALTYLDTAISINRTDTLAHADRAFYLLKQGNDSLALKALNQTLSIDSTHAISFMNRGIYYKNQKKYNLALKDYNRAIKFAQEPQEYYYAHFSRGLLYCILKKYNLAILDLNKYILVEPTNPDAFYYRGISLHNLKRYRSALEDFEMVINLDSKLNNADLYYRKAQSLYFLKQYDLAIKVFDSVLYIDNSNSHVINRYKGMAYLKLSKLDKAEKSLNMAIEIDPYYELAYNSRGIYFLKKGELNNSISDFKQAISIDNKSYLSYINLFFAYCLKYWYSIVFLCLGAITITKRKKIVSIFKR